MLTNQKPGTIESCFWFHSQHTSVQSTWSAASPSCISVLDPCCCATSVCEWSSGTWARFRGEMACRRVCDGNDCRVACLSIQGNARMNHLKWGGGCVLVLALGRQKWGFLHIKGSSLHPIPTLDLPRCVSACFCPRKAEYWHTAVSRADPCSSQESQSLTRASTTRKVWNQSSIKQEECANVHVLIFNNVALLQCLCSRLTVLLNVIMTLGL